MPSSSLSSQLSRPLFFSLLRSVSWRTRRTYILFLEKKKEEEDEEGQSQKRCTRTRATFSSPLLSSSTSSSPSPSVRPDGPVNYTSGLCPVLRDKGRARRSRGEDLSISLSRFLPSLSLFLFGIMAASTQGPKRNP